MQGALPRELIPPAGSERAPEVGKHGVVAGVQRGELRALDEGGRDDEVVPEADPEYERRYSCMRAAAGLALIIFRRNHATAS